MQSVHDRLLRIAKTGKDDFNIILARYAVERLLYRLSRTRHADRFVLKGAMLFMLWLNRLHRPTRNLDLLGVGQVDEQVPRAVLDTSLTMIQSTRYMVGVAYCSGEGVVVDGPAALPAGSRCPAGTDH